MSLQALNISPRDLYSAAASRTLVNPAVISILLTPANLYFYIFGVDISLILTSFYFLDTTLFGNLI